MNKKKGNKRDKKRVIKRGRRWAKKKKEEQRGFPGREKKRRKGEFVGKKLYAN